MIGQHQCTLNSFTPVSSDVIEAYIKSLSSCKAITDYIPLRVFKAISPILLPSLTHIVNLSLSSGKVPDILKIANVTPIHKGGDPNDPDNYRPISILPIVSKCIEHCVSEQMTRYFESNQLLTKNHYGFRKNHSTTYLTLDLFDRVFDSKSKKKQSSHNFSGY